LLPASLHLPSTLITPHRTPSPVPNCLPRPCMQIGDLGLSKTKKGSFISGNMRGTLPW
jgi:hypothetical protein